MGENTDSAGRGDMHEGFDIGFDESMLETLKGSNEKKNYDHLNGKHLYQDNLWPPEEYVPKFRYRLEQYYKEVLALGKRLFHLFALALKLDENFFDDKNKNNAAIMRVLHYPPQTGVIDNSQIGIGAHTGKVIHSLILLYKTMWV